MNNVTQKILYLCGVLFLASFGMMLISNRLAPPPPLPSDSQHDLSHIQLQLDEIYKIAEKIQKNDPSADILSHLQKDLTLRHPVNVFFDCGANRGDSLAQFTGLSKHSLGAFSKDMFGRAALRPGGWHTYSFEGHPKFDAQLLEVAEQVRALPVSAGGPFTVFMHNQTVVGAKQGEIEFYLDTKSDVTWGSSILSTHPDVNLSRDGTIIKIPMIDIVDLILTKYRVTDYVILKLDIEGAEIEIMQKIFAAGALPLIDELYLEFHAFAPGYPHRPTIEWILSAAPDLFIGTWE